MRASAKDNVIASIEKMSDEAKKIFEALLKHSDAVFNQTKKIIDRMSAFD